MEGIEACAQESTKVFSNRGEAQSSLFPKASERVCPPRVPNDAARAMKRTVARRVGKPLWPAVLKETLA